MVAATHSCTWGTVSLTTPRRPWRLFLVITAALGIAAACQGASTSSAAPTPATTPSVTVAPPTAAPTVSPATSPPGSPSAEDKRAAAGLLINQSKVLEEYGILIARIGKVSPSEVADAMTTLSMDLDYRRMVMRQVYTMSCLTDAVSAWTDVETAMKQHVDDAIEAVKGGDTEAAAELTGTDLPTFIPKFQAAYQLATTACR